MKRGIDCISILFFVFVLASCNKSSLDKNEYTNYVEDTGNGLKKELKINGWEYLIQYKPINYLLCKENQSLSSARAKNLQGTLWFTVQFRYTKANVPALKIDVQSLDEYNQRLNYYLNQAQGDIEIEYGGAVLYPISYLFETNYGLTPHETMVVGFALPNEATDIKHDVVFKFHDKIFKNGIIKTSIALSDIKKIPQLNFK